jgi:hypothetical protein
MLTMNDAACSWRVTRNTGALPAARRMSVLVGTLKARDRRDGSPAHAGGGDTGSAGFPVDSPAIMTRASVLSERR